MPDNMNMFVVVCDKFHLAVGIFGKFEEAQRAARMLTASSTVGCLYRVVPLDMGETAHVTNSEPRVARGYL